MQANPYATGVLTPDIHGPLVPYLERFADDANIAPECIWTPLGDVCGPAEIEWVQRFPLHRGEKVFGLAYVGWSPTLRSRTAWRRSPER